MKQLTVRNVPPRLARVLEEERQRRRTSMNQTVLDLLHQALGLTPSSSYDNGLGQLAGTWSEDAFAEFVKATEFFEQVDEELWRQ